MLLEYSINKSKAQNCFLLTSAWSLQSEMKAEVKVKEKRGNKLIEMKNQISNSKSCSANKGTKVNQAQQEVRKLSKEMKD